MDDQVQSNAAKSEILRKELENAQASILDLQLKLTTLNAELTKELGRGETLRDQACFISNELADAKTQLRLMENRLEQIENGAGWRLLQRCHAIVDHFLPFGTLRREAYRRTVSRLIKSLTGGPGGDAPSQPPRDPREETQLIPKESSAAIDLGQESLPEIDLQCISPQSSEICVRHHLIRGWASSWGELSEVQILVDGEKIGDAFWGQSAANLGGDQPSNASAHISSFFYLWETATVMDGAHTLTIRAEGKSGARKDLVIPVAVRQWAENSKYGRWIWVNEPSSERLSAMAKEAKDFSYAPLISIIAEVLDTPKNLFEEAIASVRRQVYANWELCLAVGHCCNSELVGLIRASSREDSRIKYIQLDKGPGTSDAANFALSLATGAFVTFMDGDGQLSADALYWNLDFLQNHRDADLIYSDEDKIDLNGTRHGAFFKPDWSPDLLLSKNYIGNLLLVRRQLLHEIGGFRSEYDGGRNYDLILRLIERTQNIFHIPRILFHDRTGPGPRNPSTEISPQANTEAELALNDYLKRNQIRGHVEAGCTSGLWQVRYNILENPKVGIIIPTGGRMEMLQPCLKSLFNHTDYTHYEILLVDNSKSGQVEQFAKSLVNFNADVRYLDYRDKKFNFSALNNFAVGRTEAPLVLLLNDDVTIINKAWLSAMVEHGQRPSVGAVGAKLLYPSGNIQHAGVLMGTYECTSHAFKHIPANSLHYFAFPQIIRNCSAVTAACMLTKRKVYLEVGGLDEKHLAVAFQDVDFCLKVCEAGYRIVYTPLAVLIHRESVTKEEKVPSMKEVRYLQKKWRQVIARDPYYNPNLTRKAEDYSLRME